VVTLTAIAALSRARPLTAAAILAASIPLPAARTALASSAATACTVATACTAIIGKLPQAIAAIITSLRRIVAPAVAALLLSATSTNAVGIRLTIASFMLIVANNKGATLITDSVMFGELHWAVRLLLYVPLQRELIAVAAVGPASLVDFAAYARLPKRKVLTTVNARIPVSTLRTRLLDRTLFTSLAARIVSGVILPIRSLGGAVVAGAVACHTLATPTAAAHRRRADATHWLDPPTAAAHRHRYRYRTDAHW
jgi:hypothetical protein